MPALRPEQWQEISPYLDHGLSLSKQERAAWLSDLRAQRSEIADLVEELLEEHEVVSQAHFLEHQLPSLDEDYLTGETVGPYKLISRIGEGGMGNVWLAERADGRFERRVAIKFVHFAITSRGAAERFKREGKILGQLRHPHIAELIDAGLTPKGEPYLVLEYIPGQQIDEYCDKQKLGVEARIELFLDVLRAVAHAHAHLVVHRDIKPSNVLVSSDREVKLLDFGIAKLLADDTSPAAATLLTLEGGGAMTPLFAAPEQVTGGPITTATDIYALGTLLFVLLAGQHPTGPGPHSPADLVKSITEIEPARLSHVVKGDASSADNRGTSPERLSRLLAGDVETIVAKALKKSPQERYVSVTGFAEDLRHYLKQEPIAARPDSVSYRAAKFVRRNRVVLGLACFALLAVIAGIAGTLIQARTVRQQRDFAIRELTRAEEINDLNQFLLTDAAPSNTPITIHRLLDLENELVQREDYASDPANHIALLISIGGQYLDKDENEKSLQVLQQAYDLSRGLGDASVRARASCALAWAVQRQGGHARAQALVEEGLRELPRDRQYALDRVYCSVHASEVAADAGLAQNAIEYARLAEQSLNQWPYEPGSLRLAVLSALGEAYNFAGLHRQAILTFEKAFEQASRLGYAETKTGASLLESWGFALSLAGRTYDAEKILRRAVDLTEGDQAGGGATPQLLVQYGTILMGLKRLPEAAVFAERGSFRAQQLHDQVTFEQSLFGRARIYREQGNLERATEMLETVEPMLRRDLPPGHYAFATIRLDRALIASERGDQKSALELINQAITMAQNAIRSGGQGAFMFPAIYVMRAKIELRAGDATAAQGDAEEAIKEASASLQPGDTSAGLGNAYYFLAKALDARGKRGEALAAMRKSAEVFEKSVGADCLYTQSARAGAADLASRSDANAK